MTAKKVEISTKTTRIVTIRCATQTGNCKHTGTCVCVPICALSSVDAIESRNMARHLYSHIRCMLGALMPCSTGKHKHSLNTIAFATTAPLLTRYRWLSLRCSISGMPRDAVEHFPNFWHFYVSLFPRLLLKFLYIVVFVLAFFNFPYNFNYRTFRKWNLPCS